MRGLPLNFPRLQILRAEVCMAQGDLDAAASHLRDAVTTAGLSGSDGLWARGWQILINYLKGDYQQALTDAHVALARFGKAPSAHVSYFHLLEALACLARGKPMLASGALAKACESEGAWKVAAMSYIKQQPPGSFENAAKHFAGAQVAESCFLTGEMFCRAGNREMAAQYFSHGLKLPVQRAMISRLARLRLNELSAGSGPVGGTR
jgi:predicted negative regulator of RcsB-dependent stress response